MSAPASSSLKAADDLSQDERAWPVGALGQSYFLIKSGENFIGVFKGLRLAANRRGINSQSITNDDAIIADAKAFAAGRYA